MRLTLLVTAALCGLSVAANAAQQKSGAWFAYQPARQICHQGSSPPETIAHVREVFRVEPDVDDTTDDSGKVVSTIISWLADNGVQTWEVHLFRSAGACEDYARTQRPDLKKYD